MDTLFYCGYRMSLLLVRSHVLLLLILSTSLTRPSLPASHLFENMKIILTVHPAYNLAIIGVRTRNVDSFGQICL
jgi:hypothetical protein